eukprot:g1557.t1
MSDHSEEVHKITILGTGGVGKSTLIIRLVNGTFYDEYDPTIEDSYSKRFRIDGKLALLDILDTAGQEEYGSMQDQWMREGKGFLLLYDTTQESSFHEVARFKDKLCREKDQELEDIPIVLVGTKSDLKDAREVSFESGMALAKSWNKPFFETSAKDDVCAWSAQESDVGTVEKVFFECVREMRRKNEEKQKMNDMEDGKKKKWRSTMRCHIL